MPQDTTRRGPIHVALTFDDRYWAPAYATMRSICLVSRRRADLVFHLMHMGLSEEHRQLLLPITEEYGAELRFYDLEADPALLDQVRQLPPVRHRHLNFSPMVYIRLFLTGIVPADVERLIYIDSDMMVRAPIEELFELDLMDHPVAAVLDPYGTGFQTGRDFRPKRYYDTTEPFFNAGLMVIDTRRLAALDVIGTVRKTLTPEEFAGVYYDQDILNIALRNNWRVLDISWNLQNPAPAHEALNPKLVHYTGTNKPWLLFGETAYKRNYRHIMTNEYFYLFLRERIAARFPFLRPLLKLKRPAPAAAGTGPEVGRSAS
ncbi:hypothetical protein XM25_13300 [Devosia sp. H5989]|nr:hypothetical protein XM25_13300 [Devosia sp. H5989]